MPSAIHEAPETFTIGDDEGGDMDELPQVHRHQGSRMTIFVCNLVLDPSLPSSRSTSSAILILLPQIAAVEDHRDLDVQLDEEFKKSGI